MSMKMRAIARENWLRVSRNMNPLSLLYTQTHTPKFIYIGETGHSRDTGNIGTILIDATNLVMFQNSKLPFEKNVIKYLKIIRTVP